MSGTGDMTFVLTASEMAEVFKQDPSKKADGGFQALMVSLQENCDTNSGAITVTAMQRGRIRKYAFDYRNGGWENQLMAAFGRHLGPKLDREP